MNGTDCTDTGSHRLYTPDPESARVEEFSLLSVIPLEIQLPP